MWRDSVQKGREMVGGGKALKPGEEGIWARVKVRPEAAKKDEEGCI